MKEKGVDFRLQRKGKEEAKILNGFDSDFHGWISRNRRRKKNCCRGFGEGERESEEEALCAEEEESEFIYENLIQNGVVLPKRHRFIKTETELLLS